MLACHVLCCFLPHTVGVVQGLDALEGPPLRGYMSKLVNQEDQGNCYYTVELQPLWDLREFGMVKSLV